MLLSLEKEINNGLIMNWFKFNGNNSWSTIDVTLPCSLTTKVVCSCKMTYYSSWSTSTDGVSGRQMSQYINIYLQDTSTIRVGARYTSIVGVIGY